MIKRIEKLEADRILALYRYRPFNGVEILMIGGGRFYVAVHKTSAEFGRFVEEWQASPRVDEVQLGEELPSFPMGKSVIL